jgi:hypothetical protein
LELLVTARRTQVVRIEWFHELDFIRAGDSGMSEMQIISMPNDKSACLILVCKENGDEFSKRVGSDEGKTYSIELRASKAAKE